MVYLRSAMPVIDGYSNSLVRSHRKQEILAMGLEGLKIKELRVLEGLRKHSI